MKIRKNDTVLVVAGKDRGKKGKVRKALPRKEKVIVEGANMIKRHSRAKGQARQAGIIELEAPLGIWLNQPEVGYLPAKALATGLVLFWNYFANRFWTFRDARQVQTKEFE